MSGGAIFEGISVIDVGRSDEEDSLEGSFDRGLWRMALEGRRLSAGGELGGLDTELLNEDAATLALVEFKGAENVFLTLDKNDDIIAYED